MNPLLALGLAAGWIGGLFAVANANSKKLGVGNSETLVPGNVYQVDFLVVTPPAANDVAAIQKWFADRNLELTGGLVALPSTNPQQRIFFTNAIWRGPRMNITQFLSSPAAVDGFIGVSLISPPRGN